MMYAIVAITEKTRAIGFQNQLLYHLPEDLKYFKTTTEGSTVVMGYNTYMSLPKRPLPKRKNIVLNPTDVEGVLTLHSLDELLAYAKANSNETIFICGGSSVYAQTLPYMEKLFITLIKEETPVKADTFFPEFEDYWHCIKQTPCTEDSRLMFTVWEKKR